MGDCLGSEVEEDSAVVVEAVRRDCSVVDLVGNHLWQAVDSRSVAAAWVTADALLLPGTSDCYP